ncbi:MAG: amino acid adenylation domain-containing protein, partial [Acidobacteriota bacterium]
PAVMSHRGGRLTFALSEDLSDGLRRLARSSGSTLYMTLLAALQALLHRLTSQDHISIGSPVAGRRRSELEGVVGLFVNTVVLRTDLGGNPTFDDLLAQVREVSLDAFAHQDVPFEKLVDELAPERDPSRNPLFQVGFQVLEGVSEPREPAGDVSFSELQAAVPHAKFDLDLHVVDGGGGLQGSLIYCADLFEESTVRRLLGTFEGLLTAAVADPGQKLSELPVMTGEARAHLLAHAATPRTPDDPHGANLAELFAEVAARHGDRTAVQDGDTSLTYAELARRADAWAASLRRRGVRPEVPVGLLLDRGADLVTAMVAVIRAGGAYLPLDPSYPAERLRFMLEDTGAPLVIAHGDLLGDAAWLSDSTEVVRVDGGDLDGTSGEPLTAPDIAPGSLAYVTYTSGSTGRPKGVATPHRGVVNLVRGNDDYPFRKDDRVAHTANAAFDPTTLQVWGPLLAGGCVVPLDPGTVLSPQRLAAAVRERGITVLNLTAALFHQLAEHGPEAMGGLRALLSGGDRCDPHWARAAAGTGVGHLLNHYGPTEATTSCIVHRVEDLSEDAATVPIGRPMAGSSAYVIDRHGGLAAPGVAGELWIGGDGLARGYLGRPALTAAAFVPNPFADAPGERLYRSGDLVRRLPNGDLDFLGRIDHQVKLRGYRIELGEVEAALRSHGDVTSALVMLRDGAGGQRRLVAYVEAGDGADADALQAHVAERLPSYMVPAAVVVLDSFPLTPNGKVDRAALPEPQGADGDRRVRPPKTEAEITLAGIWEEVLGVESVGLDDNFFRLGGDSILAIRVVTQAFRAGLDLDPQDFFLLDTLEALAAAATPVTEVTEGPDGDAPDDDLALDEEALGDVFAELGLD